MGLWDMYKGNINYIVGGCTDGARENGCKKSSANMLVYMVVIVIIFTVFFVLLSPFIYCANKDPDKDDDKGDNKTKTAAEGTAEIDVEAGGGAKDAELSSTDKNPAPVKEADPEATALAAE